MSASEAPLMVRANITRAEWQALRVLALTRNTSAGELVAAALRKSYDLTGGK